MCVSRVLIKKTCAVPRAGRDVGASDATPVTPVVAVDPVRGPSAEGVRTLRSGLAVHARPFPSGQA
jgi:hypothetical protein